MTIQHVDASTSQRYDSKDANNHITQDDASNSDYCCQNKNLHVSSLIRCPGEPGLEVGQQPCGLTSVT